MSHNFWLFDIKLIFFLHNLVWFWNWFVLLFSLLDFLSSNINSGFSWVHNMVWLWGRRKNWHFFLFCPFFTFELQYKFRFRLSNLVSSAEKFPNLPSFLSFQSFLRWMQLWKSWHTQGWLLVRMIRLRLISLQCHPKLVTNINAEKNYFNYFFLFLLSKSSGDILMQAVEVCLTKKQKQTHSYGIKNISIPFWSCGSWSEAAAAATAVCWTAEECKDSGLRLRERSTNCATVQ